MTNNKIINVEWKQCSEDNYPEDTSSCIVYCEELGGVMGFDNCPFGWTVLTRIEAMFAEIEMPKKKVYGDD